MRIIKTGMLVGVLIAAGSAHASDSVSMEKLKTGILPSGGFYSIYEATCQNQTGTHIASVERRGRWCAEYDGQLNCFRRSREAVQAACISRDLVSVDKYPGTMGE